jgi:hypothetical protein
VPLQETCVHYIDHQHVVSQDRRFRVSLCAICVDRFTRLSYETVTKTKTSILAWKYVQKSNIEFGQTGSLQIFAVSCGILRLNMRPGPLDNVTGAWAWTVPLAQGHEPLQGRDFPRAPNSLSTCFRLGNKQGVRNMRQRMGETATRGCISCRRLLFFHGLYRP